jgi:hypothetical protein
MREFEYDISIHHLQEANKVRIFCSEEGNCSVEDMVGSDSLAVISALNERGRSGWELVEIVFGGDGFVCFWKRESHLPGNTGQPNLHPA